MARPRHARKPRDGWPPAFDLDILLPEALRGWIMDEADRKPCPPDFIAVAVLVALGSIIGARCAIKPKSRDDWLIVPNRWGGIVGLPSAKKSPAIGVALKLLAFDGRRRSQQHLQTGCPALLQQDRSPSQK